MINISNITISKFTNLSNNIQMQVAFQVYRIVYKQRPRRPFDLRGGVLYRQASLQRSAIAVETTLCAGIRDIELVGDLLVVADTL